MTTGPAGCCIWAGKGVLCFYLLNDLGTWCCKYSRSVQDPRSHMTAGSMLQNCFALYWLYNAGVVRLSGFMFTKDYMHGYMPISRSVAINILKLQDCMGTCIPLQYCTTISKLQDRMAICQKLHA